MGCRAAAPPNNVILTIQTNTIVCILTPPSRLACTLVTEIVTVIAHPTAAVANTAAEAATSTHLRPLSSHAVALTSDFGPVVEVLSLIMKVVKVMFLPARTVASIPARLKVIVKSRL